MYTSTNPMDIDWAKDWQERQKARRAADSSKYWDERSKTYRVASDHSSYADIFIDHLHLQEGETLFDMGCGNGAIAIPAALKGHRVLAADFSEGMLASLKDQVEALEIEKSVRLDINTVQMSWADDWQAAGIESNSYDVAIASRSIVTTDLKDSLLKLTDVARKRCAITLPVGSSPRVDLRILQELGIESETTNDFVYAFMILLQEGYLPSISYIISERVDKFSSKEEAVDSVKKMVENSKENQANDSLPADMDLRISEWVSNNLVSCSDNRAPKSSSVNDNCYCFKVPRHTYWAYITWNVITRDKL